jgi:hypothetical protein
MYARSITINGDPGSVDLGITFVRDEVMPVIATMEGCLGISMLVDRESGRTITTSSWRDEESMTASGAQLAPYRDRANEMMGGGGPTAEMWEVAVMHRDHASREGSCCRVTWGRPADMDSMPEFFRSVPLPRLEALDGFCSASLFLDRAEGISCATVTFDTRAALEASREPMAAIRQMASDEGRVTFFDGAELDLAIAHLRLPELV